MQKEKQPRMAAVNARVPSSLWAMVRTLARQRGLKLEYVVKQALTDWADKTEGEK